LVTWAQFKDTAARLHLTSSVDVREIEAMAKTMKHMKAIIKSYLRERVRVRRAADTIVAAHHAGIVAARQAAVQAQQDQAVLQARYDEVLLQAMMAHADFDMTDDDWLMQTRGIGNGE
jgi:hypothetical protein